LNINPKPDIANIFLTFGKNKEAIPAYRRGLIVTVCIISGSIFLRVFIMSVRSLTSESTPSVPLLKFISMILILESSPSKVESI
jgi:hypothetical protein